MSRKEEEKAVRDVKISALIQIKLPKERVTMSVFDSINTDEENHWFGDVGTPAAPSTGFTSLTSEDSAPIRSPAGAAGGARAAAGFDPTIGRPSPQPATPPAVGRQPTGPGKLTQAQCFHCDVCNIALSGLEPAKQHYAGKQHRKALQRSTVGQSPGSSVGVNPAMPTAPVPLSCTVCQKDFTGQVSAQQHFASSKHVKAEQGAQEWARKQSVESLISNQQSAPSPSARSQSDPGRASGSGGIDGMLTPDRIQGLGRGLPLQSPQGVGLSPVGRPSCSAPPGFPTGLGAPAHRVAAGGAGSRGELMKQQISQMCVSVLEEHMQRIIPVMANKIADMVIEHLSHATPTTPTTPTTTKTGTVSTPPRPVVSPRAAPPLNGTPARDDGLLSFASRHPSMPSLMSTLSTLSLESGGSVQTGSPAVFTSSVNGPQQSTDQFHTSWDNLVEKK